MEAPGTLHQAPGIREAGAGAGGAFHVQSVTFPTSMVLKAAQSDSFDANHNTVLLYLSNKTDGTLS